MSDINWTNLHQDYAKRDWVHKPSIFAEQAVSYFKKNGHVLELGAGLAQDGLYFASKGFTVACTDLKDKALREQIGAADPKLQKNITAKQCDLRELPLPFTANTFDVVYAHLSLHYFDSATTEAIFAEIYRVLKLGGIIAFFTNSTNDPEFNTGKKLEDHYFEIDGVKKRYLDVAEAKTFAKQFTSLLADNNGETYKDNAVGVHHLIRFIGRKD